MPPSKNTTNKKLSANTTTTVDKGVTTRRTGLLVPLKGENLCDPYIKRKAEASPLLKKTTKRSAFGDITNAIDSSAANVANGKKVLKKPTNVVKPIVTAVSTRATRTSLALKTSNVKAPVVKAPAVKAPAVKAPAVKAPAPVPRVSLPVRKPSFVPPNIKPKIPVKPKPEETKKSEETKKPEPQRKSVRLSSDLEKSESSLYVSALDEILDETVAVSSPALVEPEINIDKECWNDPFQVSTYAHDIFNYLKSREAHFVIEDYMSKQKGITTWMRALLVDWLVEVQENFELNHETLYLAVKLVDLYLCKVQVPKVTLQLVGAASMLIAAKYDERIPPMIDDFLYICDGAYKHRDITRMEIQILKAVNFNLGIPLSYRFLRRYARCEKVQMPLLTLARYILEFCLMEYSTITFSDSKMAAAALYLALKMKKSGEWTNTLQYFSGYKVEDFKDVALHMNSILHKKPKEALATVRNKYSHKIFFEVAKTPLIDDSEL